MNFLERVTRFLWAFIELGFLVLVSIVLVYLLLGANSGVFVLSVAQNLLTFANAVPTASFIGMAMVVGLVYIAARRMKRRADLLAIKPDVELYEEIMRAALLATRAYEDRKREKRGVRLRRG